MNHTTCYCRQCGTSFSVPAGERQCPRCGDTLVSWASEPTIDLQRSSSGGSETPAAARLVGSQLDNYWIERFLGAGGMARVYLARHLTLERPCAIKVLASGDEDAVEAFLSEARAAAALVHPNVVGIHTIGHARQLHFIEMEFVDGQSLAQIVESAGTLDPITSTRFMLQISSALAVAHQRHIIHRDVKPSNVMVTNAGDAKLADFGLAKRIKTHRRARRHVLAGTPNFMAPELFAGQLASTQSDVYAMGVTYHALLTGRPPIACNSVTELMKTLAATAAVDLIESEKSLPSEVMQVLRRCLNSDPQARYTDAVQLHEELRAVYGTLRSLDSVLREALGHENVEIRGGGDQFLVRVPLPDGRSQTVHVELLRKDAIAGQIIRIYSVCGPASDCYYAQALELNAHLPHGAIAIEDVGGQPHFVMINTYPRATCDPEEIRESVLSIATHADETEHHLTGSDHH